jgi:hypothetical protein
VYEEEGSNWRGCATLCEPSLVCVMRRVLHKTHSERLMAVMDETQPSGDLAD